MPHTLCSLELTDEVTAELTVLVRSGQGFGAEATRSSNRIRGLLAQFHSSSERVLEPRLGHQALTWPLERYGSPAALRIAGRRRLAELIRPKAPRMAARLIDDVFDALDEQSVVPGNRHPRHRDPVPGRLTRCGPRPAPGTGSSDQQPAQGAPSFRGS